MRVSLILSAFAVLCAVTACGGTSGEPVSADTPGATAAESGAVAPTEIPTAATPTAASPAATSVVLSPSIEDALSCREPPVRPATAASNAALQRHDLTEFPLATCNDGSPAVLYFRPYQGEANRDKWVIVLTGGGSCASAQECADRWCGELPVFNADNMSTRNAGNTLPGTGILAREAFNPFANYNHVEVRYCSSDVWAGQALGVTGTAKDPATGQDVTFQMNFAGAYVIEALLATLRQEGVDALVYDRTRARMPDLDDASEVVFAGGSAGGNGVIFNLDRVADTIRASNGKVEVRGFIDAIVGPDDAKLGYASTNNCLNRGLCSHEAVYHALYARELSAQGERRWTDESCLSWHRQHEPGTEWQCYDINHLLANHITTPYFVRTALADELLASGTIDAGFTTADGQPMTVLAYGQATAAFVRGLPDAVESGHERSAVAELPGAFAVSCYTHYTLLQTDLVTGSSVTVAGDRAYTLFDVWNNWVEGKAPAVVVTTEPRTDQCPRER